MDYFLYLSKMNRLLWRWWYPSYFTSAGLMWQKGSKYIKLQSTFVLPVNTKQIEPTSQANVDGHTDIDDVHGSKARAGIWRLSRVGARCKCWIMQKKSQILPKISKQSSFIHSHVHPPVHPPPIFSISILPSPMWRREMRQLWGQVHAGSGWLLRWYASIQWFHGRLPVVSSGVWMMLAWTCCLFALCLCCFFLCLCVLFCFFGVCGWWQSGCMFVERSCKSPVVKNVLVRGFVSLLWSVPWDWNCQSHCLCQGNCFEVIPYSWVLSWRICVETTFSSAWEKIWSVCVRERERHCIWCIGGASRLSKSLLLVMSSLGRRAQWLVPHVSVCHPSPVGSA